MWPILLDMTEEESVQSLRHLELEAYSSLVSALRAQGSLNHEKKRILKETSVLLKISNERHKAEVRRAISDEKLNTIAYHMTGQLNSLEDWALEGRRLVPLLPRVLPQTSFSVIADEASEAAAQCNRQLPPPAHTERKRATPQPILVQTPQETFRVPDVPVKDETKKRKNPPLGAENSSLAQHLLSTKTSKIQQIYRQATKTLKQKQRETGAEVENSDFSQSPPTPRRISHHSSNPSTPKINIIQNLSLSLKDEPIMMEKKPADIQINAAVSINENLAPNSKMVTVKSPGLGGKFPTSGFDIGNEMDKISGNLEGKTPKNQKVIVVSNSQTLPTNSILQKTLSVPMNKLTKLNLEKFKLVPSGQLTTSAPVKPKLVTLKGNAGKKMIPLSQLQMLNTKGSLKVIPYSGKVFDKNIQLSNIHSPKTEPPVSEINDVDDVKMENGEQSHDPMPNSVNCNEMDLDSNETLSAGSSEAGDKVRVEEIYSNDSSMDLDGCELIEPPHHDGDEVLQEVEVIYSEDMPQ